MTAETAATTSGPCVRSWAPGRVEIAGNHVDHQGGCVIAAAIDRGIEATVQARPGTRALIESEGFDPIELALDDVSPKACDQGTTASLVRGVVAGLRARGIDVGGFLARVRSDLPVGGGLSSSAAFELSLCQALAVLFGGFQALMPLIGWELGSQFLWFIEPIDHWIAFVLLALIGANMIRESFGEEESQDASFAFKAMLPLAIATSIDALAVGVTFAFLDVNVILAISLIGAITFVISAAGVKIGNVFGSKYQSKAEFAGGAILIILGIKILIEHIFFGG